MKLGCRPLLVALLITGCEAKAPPATQDAGPTPQALPTITVKIHDTPLTLQVADTEEKRATGLMYVHAMPQDRGMVFVFPAEQPLSFWMKNTPIDLDIAFVDHTGKVVSVKTMRAYDLTTVPSDEPATYAIEMNAGEAARLKLETGQHVDLPGTLTAHD